MTTEEKIRLLIVDDINETRESIKRMLQFDQNIEVVGTARSGREAIEQSQKVKPDVILMDINMPDMDGITATEAIRRKLPYVQVVILSVQNDPDYMRRAMRVGAHDFLPKPPMIDELTNSIHQAGKVAIEEKQKHEQELAARTAALSMGGTGLLGKQGKIILVYSPKGGVGCTTIATNLAFVLQGGKRKVILVDGSMQYGDIPIFLSLQSKNSVIDLAPRVDELDSEIIEDVVVVHPATDDFHILAGPPRPEMAEKVTGDSFGKLLQYLKGLYEYIIVDTSSYLNDTTLSAIEIADMTILVTTQDIPAIKNINSFLTLADALGFSRERIAFIMNRFDRRIGITPERVGESLRQEVVLAIPLDEKSNVTDSIKRGTPIILENKNHPVSKAIISLSSHIREKIKKIEEAEQEA